MVASTVAATVPPKAGRVTRSKILNQGIQALLAEVWSRHRVVRDWCNALSERQAPKAKRPRDQVATQ